MARRSEGVEAEGRKGLSLFPSLSFALSFTLTRTLSFSCTRIHHIQPDHLCFSPVFSFSLSPLPPRLFMDLLTLAFVRPFISPEATTNTTIIYAGTRRWSSVSELVRTRWDSGDRAKSIVRRCPKCFNRRGLARSRCVRRPEKPVLCYGLIDGVWIIDAAEWRYRASLEIAAAKGREGVASCRGIFGYPFF